VIRHLTAVAILACAGGCAATRPPGPEDPEYPRDWPPAAGLGEECSHLNGSFENDGIFVGARGTSRAMRITDLFFLETAPDSAHASLIVSTIRRDRNGDTFASLEVIVPLPGGQLDRRMQAYCVRGQLYVLASTDSGGLPYVYFAGDQTNAWFDIDAAGDLVVRIGKYGGGLAVSVPFGWQSVGWARFPSVKP
jgi:hypothetical protein